MSYGQSSTHIASKELEMAISLTVSKIHAIFDEDLAGKSPPRKKTAKPKKKKVA